MLRTRCVEDRALFFCFFVHDAKSALSESDKSWLFLAVCSVNNMTVGTKRSETVVKR